MEPISHPFSNASAPEHKNNSQEALMGLLEKLNIVAESLSPIYGALRKILPMRYRNS